jgi:hypothetical protein
MSLTLVLLGYEARVLVDAHPNIVRDTLAHWATLLR